MIYVQKVFQSHIHSVIHSIIHLFSCVRQHLLEPLYNINISVWVCFYPPSVGYFLGGLVTPGFSPWALNEKKYKSIFFNFNMTFLATWGCASDVLKMLPKFKMTARVNSKIVCGLKVRNYSNFTITSPTIWKCAGDFFKVLLKFKMAAMDELHIFENSEKYFTFYNPITRHLETFRWFYWNLIWPPQVDFLNICDRRNSNLIYCGEW